jgi:hypothetical protein
MSSSDHCVAMKCFLESHAFWQVNLSFEVANTELY